MWDGAGYTLRSTLFVFHVRVTFQNSAQDLERYLDYMSSHTRLRQPPRVAPQTVDTGMWGDVGLDLGNGDGGILQTHAEDVEQNIGLWN